MRLLTYNIHKGIGGRDRRYRLQRILDVIDTANADIVCLQEVDRNVRRSSFDDQPELLTKELGFEHFAFQINHKIKTGGYGNCTLSRFPIACSADISLRIGNRKNRQALHTIIETPVGMVSLANLHLGLAEKDRHLQIQKLLESEAFRRHSSLPSVVTGDTNDWRNTLHKGAFREYGYNQMSHLQASLKTFPAYIPLGALDKAFANSRIKLLDCHTIDTKLAKAASDHLPVIIDFSVYS